MKLDLFQTPAPMHHLPDVHVVSSIPATCIVFHSLTYAPIAKFCVCIYRFNVKDIWVSILNFDY